jgi:superfamily II DNA or RNA helicase
MTSEIAVENFLPKYPNINNIEINDQVKTWFMNPYDFFEQSIYNKREFNELVINKENIKEEGEILLNHQRIVARFLSPYTIYDGLFLFHEMGTGKSCSAFGAVENLRKTGMYKNCIVLTASRDVLASLIEELASTCTNNAYMPPENLDTMKNVNKIKKIMIEINTKTQNFYLFNNFFSVAKILQNLSDEAIESNYSNTIFILDEVHNLTKAEETKEGDFDIYKQIFRLLQKTKNCKKIVMSGTPMLDNVNEIGRMLNLVLPLDLQLPIDDQFTREFLTKKDHIYTFLPEKEVEFKSKIRGYVSYLKASLSNVNIVFKGEVVAPLKYFTVFPSRMSDFQTKVYNEAYAKATTNVYNDAFQASLFVFRNGTYGDAGIKPYKTKKSLPNLPVELQDLANEGVTYERKLEVLQNFSAIYASTIREILKEKNAGKNTIIFNKLVAGSGCLLFARILSYFGFTMSTNGLDKGPAKRFAIITKKTAINVKVMKNIRDMFNNEKNKNGAYLQIIIFSQISSEGVSFKNVQQIHIQTPHWNYSLIAQVIARGLRVGSHRDLISQSFVPEVDIYLHCAIARDRDVLDSIDMNRYVTSEIKDLSIKNVEYAMKQAAVDCAIFYERNVIRNSQFDNSRFCEYRECLYSCDNITQVPPTTIDYSTYQLYYTQKDRKEITKIIKEFFSHEFYISIFELMSLYLQNFKTIAIMETIKELIANNTPINNRYNFICVLREENNVLFLSEKLNTNFLCSSYTSNPVGVSNVSFDEALFDVVIRPQIDALVDGTDETTFRQTIDFLPFIQKRQLIESVLEGQYADKPVDEFVKHYFSITDNKFYVLEQTPFEFDSSQGWIKSERKISKEIDYRDYYSKGFLILGIYNDPKIEVKDLNIDNFWVIDLKEKLENEGKEKAPGRICKNNKDIVKALILTKINAPLSEAEQTLIDKHLQTVASTLPEFQGINVIENIEIQKRLLLTLLRTTIVKDYSDHFSEENSLSTLRRAYFFGAKKITFNINSEKLCLRIKQYLVENNLMLLDESRKKGFGYKR